MDRLQAGSYGGELDISLASVLRECGEFSCLAGPVIRLTRARG